MSKIDELLAKMCPNGVTPAKLGEIVDILDNLRKPVSRDKREIGEIPYYGANGIQGYVKDYIFDGTYLLVGEDGSVINKDRSPILHWVSGKIWVNNHAHVLAQKKDGPSLRYIYFALQEQDVSAIVQGVPPKINQGNLKNIRIPIPPLEIQKEIVAILDKFAELEAELEAERGVRKAQYEFNRNFLLSFNEGEAPSYSLGEIGQTISGLRGKSKNDFTDGNAPYVSYVDISNNPELNFEVQKLVKVGKSESQNEIRLGDVLITGSSETKIDVGLTSVVTIEPKIKTYINSFCFIWRPHKEIEILPQFSKHLFRGREFRDKVIETANGVTRMNISKPKLLAIKIPVPPLKIQREIVEILNNFDTLANDISVGIPAEINARRLQYEYYRNKLLSFRELEKV